MAKTLYDRSPFQDYDSEKVRGMLEAEVERRREVRIDLFFGTTAYGFILDVGEDWFLMRNAQDYRLDGYECYRIDDITKIGCYAQFSAKVWKNIASPEEKYAIPFPLKLDGLAAMLQPMKRTGEICILDFDYDGDSMLLLGVVEKIGKDFALLNTIDPDGRFSRDNPSRISLKRVSGLRFRDSYTDAFTRFMKR